MAKILVVDDEIYIREIVRSALGSKGYEVTTASTAGQSLELIVKEPFDLILLDIELGGESGIDVLKKIRQSQNEVPVVIYSGILTPAIEKEARTAGAQEALNKNVGLPQLVEQIGKILKARNRIFETPSSGKEKCILIVDDEAGIRDILRGFFNAKGYKTSEAASGEEAIQLVRSEKFSAVLLDFNMTGIDGLETLKRLLEINPKLGVVMVTSEQDDEKVTKAMALGAYGYVLKPFDFMYLELVVMSKLIIAENV